MPTFFVALGAFGQPFLLRAARRQGLGVSDLEPFGPWVLDALLLPSYCAICDLPGHIGFSARAPPVRLRSCRAAFCMCVCPHSYCFIPLPVPRLLRARSRSGIRPSPSRRDVLLSFFAVQRLAFAAVHIPSAASGAGDAKPSANRVFTPHRQLCLYFGMFAADYQPILAAGAPARSPSLVLCFFTMAKAKARSPEISFFFFLTSEAASAAAKRSARKPRAWPPRFFPSICDV